MLKKLTAFRIDPNKQLEFYRVCDQQGKQRSSVIRKLIDNYINQHKIT